MTRILLVLLCLGGGLLASQPDPKRWESTIARFDKQDLEKPPPKEAILFTGSSSIARWTNVAKYFPDLPVINRGFGGSTIPEVNHFLDRIVIKHHPRIVVLFCGGNDMAAQQRTPEQVLADFHAFYQRIHAKLPATRVFYLSIHLPPGRLKQAEKINKANALIAAECAKNPKLQFVNIYDLMLGTDGKPNPELYSDPLHPSSKAYQLWADKLKPLLK